MIQKGKFSAWNSPYRSSFEMIGDVLTLAFAPACTIFYNLISHMLHVWNIYQHLPNKNHPNVSKYTIHGAYGYQYTVDRVG